MRGPFGLIIYGVIAIVVSIVLFNVAIGQLDTAITTANTTVNEMTGLVDIMGIYGILFWVVITGAGIAMLGFGTVGAIRGGRKK